MLCCVEVGYERCRTLLGGEGKEMANNCVQIFQVKVVIRMFLIRLVSLSDSAMLFPQIR